MVKLDLKYGLPFCKITLIYKGKSMKLGNVLIDTGSVGTILKMDRVEKDDTIETISGVGGIEFVYKKNIDGIKLGNLVISNFIIEVGAMDYGFEINGIIGMNFLREAGAIINLGKMAIYD